MEQFEVEGDVLLKCNGGDFEQRAVVPKGVVVIGRSEDFGQGVHVFSKSAVTEVVLGGGVKEICNQAFYGAYIARICFCEGLETIGANAFYKGYYCNDPNGLNALRFPKTLRRIGFSAFERCNLCYAFVSEHTVVEELAFPPECEVLIEMDDGNVTKAATLSSIDLDSDGNIKLVRNKALEVYDLSPIVDDYGISVFVGEDGKLGTDFREDQITYKAKCVAIHSEDFCGCNHLKKLVIPSTVQDIEERAFWKTPIKTACVAKELKELVDAVKPFPKGCVVQYSD